MAGCGAIAPPDEGGMGLPQQLAGETYGGARRNIAGTLTVAQNGCVYLAFEGGERLLIFPAGSTLSNPARLPDGTELHDGEVVIGQGVVIATDTLPGGRDGYWGNVTGYCTGDLPEAVVFDELSAGQ